MNIHSARRFLSVLVGELSFLLNFHGEGLYYIETSGSMDLFLYDRDLPHEIVETETLDYHYVNDAS